MNRIIISTQRHSTFETNNSMSYSEEFFSEMFLSKYQLSYQESRFIQLERQPFKH